MQGKRLTVGIICLLTVVLAGCGTTKTTTVTVAGVPPLTTGDGDASAATERSDFCASENGDALQQADTEANAAFNDANQPHLVAAVKKALKAGASAPPGASCAVEALDGVRSTLNTSASNLPNLDYKKYVKQIRALQEERSLQKALD